MLGGSFNPIHIGHLAVADEVATVLGYDKVLFVPTGNPPHKQMADSLSGETRLEMVRLAVEDDDRFGVEDCEILRNGYSYTWDTVCYLEEKYRDVLTDRIGLIMGDDLLPGFRHWHRASDLAEKCTLILAMRPMTVSVPGTESGDGSHSNKAVGEYAKLESVEDFRVEDEPLLRNAVRLNNSLLPVSSTQIRRSAANGGAYKYLVPSKVFKYIEEGKIYGDK